MTLWTVIARPTPTGLDVIAVRPWLGDADAWVAEGREVAAAGLARFEADAATSEDAADTARELHLEHEIHHAYRT